MIMSTHTAKKMRERKCKMYSMLTVPAQNGNGCLEIFLLHCRRRRRLHRSQVKEIFFEIFSLPHEIIMQASEHL